MPRTKKTKVRRNPLRKFHSEEEAFRYASNSDVHLTLMRNLARQQRETGKRVVNVDKIAAEALERMNAVGSGGDITMLTHTEYMALRRGQIKAERARDRFHSALVTLRQAVRGYGTALSSTAALEVNDADDDV